MEAEIIADSVESGLSVSKTLSLVNEHQMEDMGNDDELATISSAILVVKRPHKQFKQVKKKRKLRPLR